MKRVRRCREGRGRSRSVGGGVERDKGVCDGFCGAGIIGGDVKGVWFDRSNVRLCFADNSKST